jgi:hypothetical protein
MEMTYVSKMADVQGAGTVHAPRKATSTMDPFSGSPPTEVGGTVHVCLNCGGSHVIYDGASHDPEAAMSIALSALLDGDHVGGDGQAGM